MNKLFSICTALCLTSTAALAAPTVTGNTISWPDDGWYQVQDATTFQQICAGTSSCTVEPGSYIVINHTSGERFEGIQVEGTGTPVDQIVVSGNTISWPDDGWYQVQRADDYSEVCAGGLSCAVEPGTYIVINHTSATRYESILVDGDSTVDPDPSGSEFLPASQTAPLLASIGTGSPLSVSNYNTFLPAFYRTAGTQLLETISNQVQMVQDELRAAQAGESNRFVAESVTSIDDVTDEIVFACPDGGQVTASLVSEESPQYLNLTTMDFDSCQVEDDTLSGNVGGSLPIVPGGIDGGNAIQSFGGFQYESTLYPFADDVIGFGSVDDQFTVENGYGLKATLYAGADRFSRDGLGIQNWRGNWKIESADENLLVTDMIIDNSGEQISIEDNRVVTRLKPYFSINGTVTNNREISTINLETLGALDNQFENGSQTFADTLGGILSLEVARPIDDEISPIVLRIDTEATVLEQELSQDDDTALMLFGK